MSRIFISHSSRDDSRAVEVVDWLATNGWRDVFLDIDPARGLAAGERWQNALRAAADRCEAVLFLISCDWLQSRWCLAEYLLAKQLGKRLFPVIIGNIDISAVPADISADQQVVDLVRDPHAWARLEQGLKRAGLEANTFAFAVGRRPYPGFEALTEEDAAIFFGREAQMLRGLDRLRLMRDAGTQNMLVVLGASGAGKSSFLRAGLWPRLRRDDRNFLPLPVMRPERAMLTGGNGLYASIEGELRSPRIAHYPELSSVARSRAAIADLVCRDGLAGLLALLRNAAAERLVDPAAPSPTLILCVDQAEELLNEEGQAEAEQFLELITEALASDHRLLLVLTVRSDAYPRLQSAEKFAAILREPFDLPPMLPGSLRSVIEGPAQLTVPPLKVEPALVDALLADATGPDALPLLAFTLHRLDRDYGADGLLALRHYQAIGGIHGVVTKAVEEALVRGRERGFVPKDEKILQPLLRLAFIPSLARVDEAGDFVRRVARLEEIPEAARPLVDLFVEARLLTRHRSRDEVVEIAHEALLREWSLLREILEADREFLIGKRQLADDLAIWSVAPTRQKAVALLSGLRLIHARQWLAERGQHEFSQEERAFIGQSARAADRSRRWRTGLAAAVILLLTCFSGVAAWQWAKAVDAAATAERNAAEARSEKTRADENAAEAKRSAEDAGAQKAIAERETQRATQQAARAEARAELVRAQLIMRDDQQGALRRAYDAAQSLDALGAGDEALPDLRTVLNFVRELPPPKPYIGFQLGNATVFARQPASLWDKEPIDTLIAGRPATRPLTIVGTGDITGIIDDRGRAIGAPIGGPNYSWSGTNDAAWLDNNHFVLATGAWIDPANKPEDVVAVNASLRLYSAEGRLVREYLAGHAAPITAVAVLELDGQHVILAGDATGNVLMVRPDGQTTIASTGILSSVTRILVFGSGSDTKVSLVFARTDGRPRQSPVPAPDAATLAQNKQNLVATLGINVQVSYIGNRSSDDVNCAVATDGDSYICNGNKVEHYYSFDYASGPTRVFTPFSDTNVYAIAVLADPPMLATAAKTGQVKLWRNDGTLLSEISTNDHGQVNALGFLDGGHKLAGSSLAGTRIWDLQDIIEQFRQPVSSSDDTQETSSLKASLWLRFLDAASPEQPVPDWGRINRLLSEISAEKAAYTSDGAHIIAAGAKVLRVIDSRTLAVTDAAFDNFHPAMELRQAVADERGGTVCALFDSDEGSDSGKTQPNKFNQPVKKRLYAINPGTAPVWLDMAMPNGTTAAALATFDVAGVTNCLAASGQSISFLHPDTGRSETIGILAPRMGSIKRIAAAEKSDSVVVGVDEPTGGRSVLEIVRLRPDASGGSINASITASAKSADQIERVAISAEGTRILAATHREIRLFDANLNMLMPLPAPGYAGLNFNSDNSAIRSRGLDEFYEQDLRVQTHLKRARQLLDDWARYDEHNDLYSRATEEKDTAKSRSILKDATSRFPRDAVFLLLLANRDFYSPSNSDDRNHAMELYDRSNLIDPFNPVTRYMRGKARSTLGDDAGAAEDFSAAIELPHMLPAVPVIAGFIGINKAVAELSRKLINQAQGEFFLRRAWARLHTKDWQSAVDDIGWLRQHNVTSVAAFEFEAFALEKLGNTSAAIESYRQAASTLKDAKGYGLEEFNGIVKEAAWRDLVLAIFSVRIGDAQRISGQLEEARAAYTAAREMIATALASPDLTAPTRAALEKLSDQLAKQN